MLRLIFWGILFYIGYKLLGRVVNNIGGKSKQSVKSSGKENKPLDLKKFDVEDADFEDVK